MENGEKFTREATQGPANNRLMRLVRIRALCLVSVRTSKSKERNSEVRPLTSQKAVQSREAWQRNTSKSGTATSTLPVHESLWTQSYMHSAAANPQRRSARISSFSGSKRFTAPSRTTLETRLTSTL